MTLNGNASVPSKSLASLAKAINGDHWALMQLLLSLSKKETFKRILFCPTYPIRTKTKDLETRLQLFHESTESDPYRISHVLALLYESTIELKYRKKHGQYFTPPEIAKEAITLLNLKPNDAILDPGSGTGCFAVEILRQIRKVPAKTTNLKYLGIENDPVLTLCTAISLEFAGAPEDWRVLYSDFLSLTPKYLTTIGFQKTTAIVANPPFVRFHRLGKRNDLADEFDISLFSGMHSYFLAHSTRLLHNGRMVFILPLEMGETNYGSDLIKKLQSRFVIEKKCVYYDRLQAKWGTTHAQANGNACEYENLLATITLLKEHSQNLKKDNSCLKAVLSEDKSATLNVFASVHRGISSGSNDYFVLTHDFAQKLMIPNEYLTRIIPPKTPHSFLKDVFEIQDWETLKNMGKPCLLLTIKPKTPLDTLPTGIKQHLRLGESKGIHLLPTCKNRKPWYSIKVPETPPDYIFTYMFRGKPNFVFNKAGVYILTNLLGVYLKHPRPHASRLPEVAGILNAEIASWLDRGLVGRRYAGGLTKLEPRDLERMPISGSILREIGISTLE